MSTSNSPSFQEPTTTTSRRLPPPCWSHDETVALIESYRDKWYSLRRGNLRATHWQEVADDVAARCNGNVAKTSIQCRHKMEKLRKRYRSEIQRIGNMGIGNKYPSSWVHFKIMDLMELGLSCRVGHDEDEEDGREGVGDELILYPKGITQAIALPVNRQYQGSNGNGNGARIKIPNGNRVLDDLPPNMNPNYGSRKEEVDGDGNANVIEAMVGAVLKMGDGFVKMERMKMEMAREFESMRMKMEMKRTEMILEWQQKLVDSFSKTVMEKNKKVKRMPTPES